MTDRTLSASEVSALIGVLASVAGLVMAGRVSGEDVNYLRRRMLDDGIIAADSEAGAGADVSDGLEQLVKRLRDVFDEN